MPKKEQEIKQSYILRQEYPSKKQKHKQEQRQKDTAGKMQKTLDIQKNIGNYNSKQLEDVDTGFGLVVPLYMKKKKIEEEKERGEQAKDQHKENK